MYTFLGGGNSKFVLFSSLLGEDDPILTIIFQMGWNHQLGLNSTLIRIAASKFHSVVLCIWRKELLFSWKKSIPKGSMYGLCMFMFT